MVIMSDAEAFGWKLCGIISLIILVIILLIPNKEKDVSQQPKIVFDTVSIIDTVNVTDTVFVYRTSKPDTVYVNYLE